MESSFVAHRRFSDFDELAETARGWSLDLRQLDRGRFDGEILQAAGGGVLLSHARFGRRLLQLGAPPPGMRTIAIPATSTQRFEWRGREVDGNHLMVFPEGGELHAVSDDSFEVYTVSVPVESFDRGLDRMETHEPAHDLVAPGARSMRALRSVLEDLQRQLLEPCPSEAIEVGLESLIDDSLLPVLAPSQPGPKRVDSRARRAVRIAVDRLYATLRGVPPSVRELAELGDVSERALRYAFRERFGVSPKQFVMALRLNGVRRALRGSESRTIRDVALDWGFWHMGQFAADYRRHFGELPSETRGCPA